MFANSAGKAGSQYAFLVGRVFAPYDVDRNSRPGEPFQDADGGEADGHPPPGASRAVRARSGWSSPHRAGQLSKNERRKSPSDFLISSNHPLRTSPSAVLRSISSICRWKVL